MVSRTLLTAEDLAGLPDDGFRYELLDGELIRMTGSKGDHSWVGGELLRLIANHAVARELGEVFGADAGYLLTENPDTVRVPDVSFVSAERLPPDGTWHRFFAFAPDLIVEVVSDSNTEAELLTKIERFFARGTRIAILVYPNRRTLAVHRPGHPAIALTAADTLDLSDVVDDLRLPVAAIFRRIPPTAGPEPPR